MLYLFVAAGFSLRLHHFIFDITLIFIETFFDFTLYPLLRQEKNNYLFKGISSI